MFSAIEGAAQQTQERQTFLPKLKLPLFIQQGRLNRNHRLPKLSQNLLVAGGGEGILGDGFGGFDQALNADVDAAVQFFEMTVLVPADLFELEAFALEGSFELEMTASGGKLAGEDAENMERSIV